MNWLRGMLVLAALGCLLQGCRNLMVRSDASDVPQPMTVADLESRGPDGNPHLELSGVLPIDWDMVYMDEYGSKEWDYALVPAVADDGEYARTVFAPWRESGDEGPEYPPIPERYRVLLKFDDARSVEDVMVDLDTATYRGIVVNGLEPLSSGAKRELRRLYPGKSLDDVILFSVGRRPPGSGVVVLYFVGAIALLAGAWFTMRDDDAEPRSRRTSRRRPRDRSREPVEDAPIAGGRRRSRRGDRAPRRRRR